LSYKVLEILFYSYIKLNPRGEKEREFEKSRLGNCLNGRRLDGKGGFMASTYRKREGGGESRRRDSTKKGGEEKRRTAIKRVVREGRHPSSLVKRKKKRTPSPRRGK